MAEKEHYVRTKPHVNIGTIGHVDHEPTKNDVAMYNYALYLNIPILVVCTKIDKVKKNQQNQVLAILKRKFDLNHNNVEVLTFSSVQKLHVQEVWQWIEQNL